MTQYVSRPSASRIRKAKFLEKSNFPQFPKFQPVINYTSSECVLKKLLQNTQSLLFHM